MIYFIYGEDSYRSKRKLEEIVLGYKVKNKSGLSLLYIDPSAGSTGSLQASSGQVGFKDFYSNLQVNSMFAEKKLIVLKNVFSAQGANTSGWEEGLLENIKKLQEINDIIIVYQDNVPDQRTKLFKTLLKTAKCQEFNHLQLAMLKKWVAQEFKNNKVNIDFDALDLLVGFVKGDLWKMSNEINKLSNYKKDFTVTKEDVKKLVRANIENEIFKTIEAVASKNKKLALYFIHKHIEDGDNALYLLSMIAYQFRSLLIIKELQDKKIPYGLIAKKSGLHPFVVQKNSYLCNQFSMEQLKKIYQKIFQIDLDIKTGKIDAETALDLLLSEI